MNELRLFTLLGVFESLSVVRATAKIYYNVIVGCCKIFLDNVALATKYIGNTGRL